jgi:hypothetical protein
MTHGKWEAEQVPSFDAETIEEGLDLSTSRITWEFAWRRRVRIEAPVRVLSSD